MNEWASCLMADRYLSLLDCMRYSCSQNPLLMRDTAAVMCYIDRWHCMFKLMGCSQSDLKICG